MTTRNTIYGLKHELHYICCELVLTHGTRLPEIPLESMCFQWIRWAPSEDFPILLELLFTPPVSSYDYTFGNSRGLDCTSGFIFDKTPLDSMPGFVHLVLVESIGHEWRGGVFVRVVKPRVCRSHL